MAISATCAAVASASDAVRSATAPWSDRTGFSVRGSSMVAASVHGPHKLILSGPSYPEKTSSIASRSADIMLRAARMYRPGRSAIRHPPVVVSTGMSISRAAVRPIRSAPGPRAGSSGR